MLFSKFNSNKPTPLFIEDGGYYGYGDPDRFNRINNDSKIVKKDESLILEYLRIIKNLNIKSQEIKELETKRIELSNKIMSNPELKESLEKLLNQDVKTK